MKILFLGRALCFALAAAALLAAPAFAQPGNQGGGNGGCGVGQQTNGCGQVVTPPPTWSNVSSNATAIAAANAQAAAIAAQKQIQQQTQRQNAVGIGLGGKGGSATASATGGSAVSRSSGGKAVANNGGVAINYPRDRLQAPALGASFSNNTAPCVKNFGLGASFAGGGGLLNVPFDASWCVDLTIAQQLAVMGCHNAAVAIIARVDRNQALRDNPCSAPRVVRAKY